MDARQKDFINKTWEASCRLHNAGVRIVDNAVSQIDVNGLSHFEGFFEGLEKEFKELLSLYARNESDSVETIPAQVEKIGSIILQMLVSTEMMAFEKVRGGVNERGGSR